MDSAALLENIAIAGARGRRSSGEAPTVLRALGAEDLPLLLSPPELGSTPKPISKIRHSHHLLAQVLAGGANQTEAGRITGYAGSTISTLQTDPAFQELLSYYKDQKEAKFLDVQERLAMVGTVALEVVHERLVEDPDRISDKDLLHIVEATMDRSVAPSKGAKGAGPTATPALSLTVSFVSPAAPAPKNEGITLELSAEAIDAPVKLA